jgi:hypothetical protein
LRRETAGWTGGESDQLRNFQVFSEAAFDKELNYFHPGTWEWAQIMPAKKMGYGKPFRYYFQRPEYQENLETDYLKLLPQSCSQEKDQIRWHEN